MDAAQFAAMSDPARNYHFSRGWDEPPPLKRERPRTGGTVSRSQNSGRDNKLDDSFSLANMQAARLDRTADAWLALGRVSIAERLAWRAAELRGVAQ